MHPEHDVDEIWNKPFKDKDKDKDIYFPLRTITIVAWASNDNENARTLYKFGL
jgi:hypothetical protein